MKLMIQLLCAGITLLWAASGRAQVQDSNGGSPGAWNQQLEARDLTGKRGQEQVDLFTGSFDYSIPINCAPARNGSQPGLALGYASGGENGWCGMGWKLDLGFIERNTKDGFPVQYTSAAIPAPATAYDDTKGFLLNLYGKEYKLYAVATNGTVEYRAETDTDFLRCFLDTSNNKWTVYDKSGNAYLFGQSSSSRVTNPKTGWGGYSGTFHWGLDEIDSATGDQTTVAYTTYNDPNVSTLPEMTIYPTTITYNGHVNLNGYTQSATGNCTITFGLAVRKDQRISYRWGFRTEQNRILTNIVCQVNGQSVWRYALAYTNSLATGRSLLSSVTVYGSDNTTALPVQTFIYQQNTNAVSFGPTMAWTNMALSDLSGSGGTDPYLTQIGGGGSTLADLVDMDGDGLPDRVSYYYNGTGTQDTYAVQHNNGTGFGARTVFGPTSSNSSSTPSDANPVPDGGYYSALNSGYTRIRDLNGDGLPDRICDWWKHFQYYTTYPYTNFAVQLNNGGGFGPAFLWPLATNDLGSDSSTYMSVIESGSSQPYVGLFDINGDGLPDRVMALDGQPETYFKVQLNTGTNFSPVRYFGPYRSQNYTNTGFGIPWSGINTPDTEMVDINGDGLPDRVMLPMNPSSVPSAMVYGNPNFNYFAVEYNDGYSFESTNTSTSVPGAYDQWPGVVLQAGTNPNNYDQIQNLPVVGLFDLNGDGLPDRVMLDETAFAQGKPQWLVYLNNGRGFNTTPIKVPIDAQGNTGDRGWCGLSFTDANGDYSIVTTLIDMNGDGLLDRVMKVYDNGNGYANTYSNYFLVQLNQGPFPDLLTNINNGMGGNYAITYKPSTAYNNLLNPSNPNAGSVLPFIYQTVSSVTASDGVNPARTTGYNYSGGYYNGPRREFHGFATVTVTNPPSPISAPYNRMTIHYFHQGGGRDQSSIGEYQDAGAFAKEGMEFRTESYGNDGNLYHVTVDQINQTYLGYGRYFLYVQLTFECDSDPGTTNRVTATKFAYDLTNENLTNTTEYGEVTGFNPASVGSFTFNNVTAGDDQYNNSHYATNIGNSYIVDHPDKVTLTDGSGNVVQEEDYTYNSSSGTPATKLTLITAGYYATNSYGSYNTYGLVGLTTDPVGVQTELGYDSTYTFKTTSRIRVTPGSDNGGDFTTTDSYDARSGLVISSTAPTGIAITNAYDALFRLNESDKVPVSSASVWIQRLGYNLGAISSGTAVSYMDETNNDGVGGVQTRTYVDGFDRPIQERIQGENSNFRVVSVAYDERGKPFLTTWPSFGANDTFSVPTNQTANWTGFDAAGRVATNQLVTANFNSNGAFSSESTLASDTGSPLAAATWGYANGSDPWWVIYTDEDGKVRRYQLDAFGRTNQIQEVDGATTHLTTLSYDLAGNLTIIVNANSENIYFAYNKAGGMVAMADPYLGQWTYQRDYAGRLRVQTDARGDVVSNSYVNPSTTYQDALGRLQQQTVFATNYTSGVLVPAFTNAYVYDSSDNGNYTVYKGLLYKMIDSQGSETNGYDTRGRLTSTTRHLNINGRNYITGYTYNDGDKITSTIYPNSGPTITNLYFTGDSLKQVSLSGGSQNYYTVSASAIDQFGHVTSFAYGNGLTTTRTYYPHSERLETISCGSSGSVFNRTYAYTAADDILSIMGTGITNSGNTVNVTYDNLHRIKTYTGLSGSYGYDAVGTITTNIEFGSPTVYTYGVRRGQAVRAEFGMTNLYDLCGNMIVRQAGLTNSQALVYDAENRLVRFSQAGTNLLLVEYGYAGDGTRLFKWVNQNPTNLQVFIGNIYEEKGGHTLFHVFAGSEQVCTFETNSVLFGGTITTNVGYYYHEDNLNSPAALSSGSLTGTQLEVNVYYPFGRQQIASPQASFKVSRQFTGQVKDDETGLYYFNARYYDPELGRFIQADDIIPDLSNPQSYNRYSYCHNDPLTYNDPGGHADHIWDIYDEHDSNPMMADLNRRSNQAADAKMATIITRENAMEMAGFKTTVGMGVDSLNPLNAGVGPIGVVSEIGGEMRAVGAAEEVVNTGKAEANTVKEGIYEFPDAKKPGKTYVGQSGDLPSRLATHERTGKKSADTEAIVAPVPGGKTQREIAEQQRIDALGGTQNKSGSQTSNVRNPVSEERQKQLGLPKPTTQSQ